MTVSDNQKPTINCIASPNRNTDLNVCTYSVAGNEFDPTDSADNCTVASIVNSITGTSSLSSHAFALGTTDVIWTVTDESGNTATCGYAVTITDMQKPTITCIAAPGRNTDLNLCTYTVEGTELDPLSATDNCSVASVTNNLNDSNTLAGYIFKMGITNVTWTATDLSGNSSTCAYNVTVTDNQIPSISCIANQSRFTDKWVCAYKAVGTEFDPTDSGDNCSVASVVNNITGTSSLASHTFTLGITNVIWKVTDGSGNTTTCTFTVTVIDSTPPTLTCVTNQFRNTGPASCNYTSSGAEFDPIATGDNCSVALIKNNLNGLSTLSGYVFSAGTTNVTWTVTDGSGNTTSCAYTVTVHSNHPPVIVCLADIAVSNDSGQCGAVVNYVKPVASDICNGPVSVSQIKGLASGSLFPPGQTINTFVAVDSSGNSDTCSFKVTVTDTEKPLILCKGNQSRTNDIGKCTYTTVGTELDPLQFSDNCRINNLTNNINDSNTLSGVNLPAGTTNIVWKVTDSLGNSSSCSFNFNVDFRPSINIDSVAPVCNNLSSFTLNYSKLGGIRISIQLPQPVMQCHILSMFMIPFYHLLWLFQFQKECRQMFMILLSA